MTGEEIFHHVLSKLITTQYFKPEEFTCTNLFLEPISNFHATPIEVNLGQGEYPILECYLENGNYFLQTTQRMFSIFGQKKIELLYSNYWWDDIEITSANLPFHIGETKIFKYYSLDKDEF